MWSPGRWIRPPVSWSCALGLGVVAALAYTGVTTVYSLIPATNVELGEPVVRSVGSLIPYSFGTIGVPVALWLRYRLRTPLVFMIGILVFWHVLVEFPPLGTGRGDSPGFLFVFVLAPAYVVGYVVLAGIEGWLRAGGIPASRRST
jgi:hypothetical protein